MTSDVVLTAALRQNLLSLQNTQSRIDTTQFRLATGRKVNSALDNPQSFFAAQALNNRASDLTRLLDGIGQSIQTIKAADNGVTALTKLVEQADSIANSARDALAAGQVEAKVVGDVDLRGIDDLDALNGIAAGDILTFSLTDENGEAVEISAYNTAGAANETVAIAANQSVDQLIELINDIHINDGAAGANATGQQAFEASLDASGQLQIRTLNGGNFRVEFTTALATDSANLAFAQVLGFGDIARVVADGTGANANNVEFSAIADVALNSFALTYTDANGDQVVADRSTLLNVVDDEDGTALFATLDAAADDYAIGINGGALQSIDLTTAANGAVTIQDFIDDINNNDSLNEFIRAEFNDETGVLSLRPISADVKSIEIGLAAGGVAGANFGFGVNADLDSNGANNGEIETIRLAAAAADLAQYETDYNRIRDQITELVTNGDTGYRGTNLLNGNNLLTTFNEFRTSSLTTNGVNFTADGLGLDAADFSRTDTVETALTQVRSAIEAIRTFGTTLANDLSVIQTRETFTKNSIETLTAGADKLTIADQNEEGAKLLALQTRQQLGVTSLSLASQSQQSILRLF